MEFDWTNAPFDLQAAPSIKEIEESIEDPLAVRLLPDSERFARESRTFCLGRTLGGLGIFTVYRTDGKRLRVIVARPMTEEENYFYERKVSQWTS